jgi:hypothetical protein
MFAGNLGYSRRGQSRKAALLMFANSDSISAKTYNLLKKLPSRIKVKLRVVTSTSKPTSLPSWTHYVLTLPRMRLLRNYLLSLSTSHAYHSLGFLQAQRRQQLRILLTLYAKFAIQPLKEIIAVLEVAMSRDSRQ